MSMNNTAIEARKISEIAVKSGTMADNALSALAENKGDAYALEVARQLPPSAKSSIVREHDFTKPSLLGLLSEPSDIVNVMAGDPITWPNPNHMSDNEILQFLEDIRTLIASLILSKEDDEMWLREVFDEIMESENAMLFMSIAFADFVRDTGFKYEFHIPYSHQGHGNIGHLHHLMCVHAPNMLKRIGTIATRYLSREWQTALADVRAHAQNIEVKEVAGVSNMLEDL
jgi:hypothetical protein